MTKEQFFAEVWQKKPLHLPFPKSKPSAAGQSKRKPNPKVRSDENDFLDFREFCSIFDLEEMWTNILSEREREREGPPTTPPEYPILIWRGGKQESKVSNPFFAFANGFSVVVNKGDRYSSSIRAICQTLMEEDGFPFAYCNIYLTPADAQTVRAHSDDREVFLLQLSGAKEWTVYANPPTDLPYREEEVGKSNPVEESMKKEIAFRGVVRAGDFLYLPRGFVHEARTLPPEALAHLEEEPTGSAQDSEPLPLLPHSLHLTIALQTSDWDWNRMVRDHVQLLLREPAMRSARDCLPLDLLYPSSERETEKESPSTAVDDPKVMQGAMNRGRSAYASVLRDLAAVLSAAATELESVESTTGAAAQHPQQPDSFGRLVSRFHGHMSGIRSERDENFLDACSVRIRNPVHFRSTVVWNPLIELLGTDRIVTSEPAEEEPLLPFLMRFQKRPPGKESARGPSPNDTMRMAVSEQVGRAITHIYQHHRECPIEVGQIPFVADPLAKVCMVNLCLRNTTLVRVS
jgi:hypothetical protein